MTMTVAVPGGLPHDAQSLGHARELLARLAALLPDSGGYKVVRDVCGNGLVWGQFLGVHYKGEGLVHAVLCAVGAGDFE
ncbi:hypothetical protein ABH931_006436 [Streptacidiphilus sp. MAP12-33]|uniref:hypothetical protein n=1 Tax=Streptacidiphilus sp. MAP12-33 TaxID=3156266 RepID=UPI0035155A9C